MPTSCVHQNTLCCLPCTYCQGEAHHLALGTLAMYKRSEATAGVLINSIPTPWSPALASEPQYSKARFTVDSTSVWMLMQMHRVPAMYPNVIWYRRESCTFACAMSGYSTGIPYICTRNVWVQHRNPVHLHAHSNGRRIHSNHSLAAVRGVSGSWSGLLLWAPQIKRTWHNSCHRICEVTCTTWRSISQA